MHVARIRFSSSVEVKNPVVFPVVTSEEVRTSRHRQYRKSRDIVAQCVGLGRVSDPVLWKQMSATVTQSISILKGEDIATILKHMSKARTRDELMLAAVCESLKTLPNLRLLRLGDMATILWSFENLNFTPSVEVLNIIGREILHSLTRFKVRNIHLCLLFRYFSNLNNSNDLVIRYKSHFEHGQLASVLEDAIVARIGRMGPMEIALIARHARQLSLKSLMLNFSRSENIQEHLVKSFLNNLDARFGQDAWKKFAYLLSLSSSPVDNTGWNRNWSSTKSFHDDDDPDDVVVKQTRKKLPLLQLDDSMVQETLKSSPKFIRNKEIPKSETKCVSDDQIIDLDFIRSLERELMGDDETKDRRNRSDRFNERIDRKCLRELEIFESKPQPQRQHLTMRRFKGERNRHLFKFTLLSLARKPK